MSKLEIILGAFALVGGLYGSGAIIHGHASEQVVAGVKISKEYHQMSSAEIQLLKAKMDLRTAARVPKDKRSDWEVQQIADLTEDKAYWAQRVRVLEAKKDIE
ncbi:hypothetical protein N9878_01785 [bacterium]|nr:hypothetical protein [bacterium]